MKLKTSTTTSSTRKSTTIGSTRTRSRDVFESSKQNLSDSTSSPDASSKWCPTCAEEKSVRMFYKHRAFKDGLKKQCKDCENAASRLRYQRLKDAGETSIKNKRETNRSGMLRRQYGITHEQYNELLEKQDSRCAICRKHIDECKTNFHVDHAHSESKWVPAGAIRGLLCWSCNRQLIGNRTDADLYLAASEYLKRHTGWQVPDDKVKLKKRRKRKIK